ncbi:MAG: hypothetical protein WC390_05280 [Sulfurimonas sp.]|jgi:hypothetical protein
MHYFSDVKINEEVYSLVYGKGKVVFTLPAKQRIDGFYAFAVEYPNKNKKVYYTIDGYPDWSSSGESCQTVFYIKDVDLNDIDIQAPSKMLSEKQILKYKSNGTLEMQCPSGIWRNTNECPEKMVEKALRKSKYYLFRKEIQE